MRALFLLCILLVQAAYAQSVLPTSTQGINLAGTVFGNTTTYPSPTITASNVGSFGYTVSAAGGVNPTTHIYHASPGQGTVTVGVAGTVPRASVAAALGRFARKSLPVVSTGFALYDLANELEFAMQGGGAQPLTIRKSPKVASGCYPVPPAQQTIINNASQPSSGCYGNGSGTLYWQNFVYGRSGNQCFVQATCSNGSYPNTTIGGNWTATGQNDPGELATVEEFEQAIANRTTWPTGSALGRALRDAVKAGDAVTFTPTLTGPATSPGPSTTKTDSAGNTTTTQTTNNYTYNNNTVSNTTTTVTTVRDAGGNITDQSTETETPELEAAPTDTPLPDVPTLYTQKFPGGMAAVWTARKAQMMASPLLSTIDGLFPTITGTNACPQFSIHLDMGRWDWGTFDLGPPCIVWDFVKVCMIILALFVARRLIFGG